MSQPAPDPARQLYRHACQDALLTATVWFMAFAWTIGYCWLRGYQHSPDSFWSRVGLAAQEPDIFPLRLGMPNWVFWGVFVPWVICTVFTVVLSFLLKDDPLELHESTKPENGQVA